MQNFTARLQPVPHGGLFVAVPGELAAVEGLGHGARVRGTVNDVGYRSSMMQYSGTFHLGVHSGTAQAAQVKRGDRVQVTIERDAEPLPEDMAPLDLTRALAREPRAAASWEKLAPAVRRGFVKHVLSAKGQQTRERRVATIVATLRKGVPPRRTWSPGGPSKKKAATVAGPVAARKRRAGKPRR